MDTQEVCAHGNGFLDFIFLTNSIGREQYETILNRHVYESFLRISFQAGEVRSVGRVFVLSHFKKIQYME